MIRKVVSASCLVATFVATCACSNGSSGHADASVVAPTPDAGVDAGLPALDAGPCGPLAPYLGDAGAQNLLPDAGFGCVRDLDCPLGSFCYDGQGCETAAATNGSPGNGRGAYAADGGACVAPPLPAEVCDSVALGWTASQDLSRSPTSLMESDTVLAADGKGTVVAAWSAIPKGTQVNQLAVSHDDGLSFQVSPAPTHATTDAANDSCLAYDPAGTWYYSWEGYADNFNGAQHVWLSTSSDATNWSAPTQVDSPGDAADGGSLDFDWIVINPVSHEPYVTYNVSPASLTASIELRYVVGAADGGFSPSVELDDGTRPDAYRDLVRSGFDSAGSFYAAWFELNDSNAETGGTLLGSALNAIYFTRLDLDPDGGVVPLAANVQVSEAGAVLPFDGPGIAVAPDGSKVYVSYLVGTAGAVDVHVATSSDRGMTWAKSVKVNDDPTCATHFHSDLAIDGQGRLWVFWYDNRDGVGHFFYSVSDDGGQTFHPNRLVGAPVFPFDTFQYSTGWLGDYYEPAVTADEIYLLWSDGREGDQSHAFFAKAALP
jgi:hypothetical protein